MGKKETTYQKNKRLLKEAEERYNRLRRDFKNYASGEVSTVVLYNTVFRAEKDFEKAVWSGDVIKINE